MGRVDVFPVLKRRVKQNDVPLSSPPSPSPGPGEGSTGSALDGFQCGSPALMNVVNVLRSWHREPSLTTFLMFAALALIG